MTPEQIDATYVELGQLFVRLELSPEKGLEYCAERLVLCRAMQDRAAELRLTVNQSLTRVMEQHLRAQQLYSVEPTPERKNELGDLDVLRQRLKMLAKMVSEQGTLLSRTSQDVRLLSDLTKQQIQRGPQRETPKELERVVDVSELVGKQVSVPEDFPAPLAVPGDTSASWTQPVSAVATKALPVVEMPVSEIDFGAVLKRGPMPVDPMRHPMVPHFVSGMTVWNDPHLVPADDRMKMTGVEDTAAVSFESLFEETPSGHRGAF